MHPHARHVARHRRGRGAAGRGRIGCPAALHGHHRGWKHSRIGQCPINDRNLRLGAGFTVVLAFVGAGVLGVFLYQNAMSVGREKMLGTLAYVAFVMVLIAEVLGRLLFYASHIRIGV